MMETQGKVLQVLIMVSLCISFLIAGMSIVSVPGCSEKGRPTPTPTITPTPQPTVPANWRMYRHDYRHTGYAPYLGPQTPRVKWHLGGFLSDDIIVKEDGTIYVTGTKKAHENFLFAISPEGVLLWQFKNPYNRLFTVPVLTNDGQIVLLDDFGHLFCLSSEGNLQWERKYNGEITINPTVSPNGDILWANHRYSYSELVDVGPDGALKWWVQESGNSFGEEFAIDAEGNIYYVTTLTYDRNYDILISRDQNGYLRWWVDPDDGAFSKCGPTIDAYGNIYCCFYPYLYSFNSKGQLNWKKELDVWKNCKVSIGPNNRIYLIVEDRIMCLTLEGNIEWISSTAFDFPPVEITVGVDGSLYCIDGGDKTIKAFNNDGSLKWDYYAYSLFSGDAPVLAANGILYVPVSSGDEKGIYAFQD